MQLLVSHGTFNTPSRLPIEGRKAAGEGVGAVGGYDEVVVRVAEDFVDAGYHMHTSEVRLKGLHTSRRSRASSSMSQMTLMR